MGVTEKVEATTGIQDASTDIYLDALDKCRQEMSEYCGKQNNTNHAGTHFSMLYMLIN